MKFPPRRNRYSWSEDDHRLAKEWEHRIQEEEKRICEEREQGGKNGLRLSKEQIQIRKVINGRKQASTVRKGRISLKTQLLRRDKKSLNEEERQFREQLEQKIQEEEKRIRENQILTHKLTPEQRAIRCIISNRLRKAQLRSAPKSVPEKPSRLAQMKIEFILNDQ